MQAELFVHQNTAEEDWRPTFECSSLFPAVRQEGKFLNHFVPQFSIFENVIHSFSHSPNICPAVWFVICSVFSTINFCINYKMSYTIKEGLRKMISKCVCIDYLIKRNPRFKGRTERKLFFFFTVFLIPFFLTHLSFPSSQQSWCADPPPSTKYLFDPISSLILLAPAQAPVI